MVYCPCDATEYHFDQRFVESKLKTYREEGPHIATRILIEALKKQDLRGASLLDIGGGLGTIMHTLFPESLQHATLVDMSSAYLSLAKEIACQDGYDEHVQYVHGDFVEKANELPEVDVVTLDRVVCCYPDMEGLLKKSLKKSRAWYALSFPRDWWFVRLDDAYKNWQRRRRGDPFTTYIHPERQIEDFIAKAGFQRCFHRATWMWKIALYRRSSSS